VEADLTGMEAEPERKPDLGGLVTDLCGASERSRWAVEDGEEPVTGGIDLAAAEALE